MMFASMCACSSDDALQQPSQVETSLVSFSFFDASMEKFNESTRAGETRAAKTWKEYFSRLDIAIIPAADAKKDTVYRVHQLNSSSDYGTLSMRLPIGKYTMVAVASTASEEVGISSPELATFPGSAATDMAYVSQEVDVTSGSTTVNGVLKRSLAKFALESSDSVDMDLDRAEVTFTGNFSKDFNPATGYGIKGDTETTYTKTAQFTDNLKKKKKSITVSLYAFVPEEVVTITVDVKVYNVSGDVIKTLHFDNVKIQQNHVTTYRGPLFTSGTTFGFTFDDKDFEKSDYDTNFGD